MPAEVPENKGLILGCKMDWICIAPWGCLNHRKGWAYMRRDFQKNFSIVFIWAEPHPVGNTPALPRLPFFNAGSWEQLPPARLFSFGTGRVDVAQSLWYFSVPSDVAKQFRHVSGGFQIASRLKIVPTCPNLLQQCTC